MRAGAGAAADARSRSSSRLVSRNGARWLTAIVSSYPSCDLWYRGAMIPALLTSTSSRSCRLRTVVGEGAHRGEAGEVGERGLDRGVAALGGQALGDIVSRPLGARRVPPGHDDAEPGARETERGLEPDPGARSGDQGEPRRSRPSQPVFSPLAS